MDDTANDLPAFAIDAFAHGEQCALATVAETWSSAPVPAGAQMLVTSAGRFAGSVSGGCVEADVIAHAADVLATGAPRLAHYTVSAERAWEVGLACGGRVAIWIEPLQAERCQRIHAAHAAGRPVARLVAIDAPADCLLLEGEFTGELLPGPQARHEALARLHRGHGGLLAVDDAAGRLLLQVWQRPLRLLIAGAVHTAQVLARIGAAAGYRVHVIDPRPGFCNQARFPGVTTHAQEPDIAMASLDPDARTAVVTLAHDPRIDDPVLQAALASDAFYVGALGSRRNHARRQRRLADAGFTPAQRARIHAPVGLDLGGRLPEEIAVAVMAEIVQVRNRQTPQVHAADPPQPAATATAAAAPGVAEPG